MNYQFGSRFATKEEIFSTQFDDLNKELLAFNEQWNLPSHNELNAERFDWWSNKDKPSHYGARFWEYPFAIVEAELEKGMNCADVGCGTSPFLALLANRVGSENVTGYDPDFVSVGTEERHSAFGAKSEFIKGLGINFFPESMDALSAPNESFDRVFCLSVLEHLDFDLQISGLKEMVRILKPGGKLILTMDLGMELVLTYPLEIVKHSGLLLSYGKLNLEWPKERFVNYGDKACDVFGLVLEKPNTSIYADYKKLSSLPSKKANRNFLRLYNHFLLKYEEALFIKEYRKNRFKSVLKLILRRYGF